MPIVKSIAKFALNFVVGLSKGLFTIGKFLFNAINWLTKPSGIIARFIVGVVKTFLAIKKAIKNLMKKTGRNSVDILCMFLAGDYIGIAVHAIAGALMGFWDWFKKTTLMKLILGVVNTMVTFGKILVGWYTIVP